MGSLLCLLVEALCPLELRPLDWQSLKSWEQEAKVFLSGSLSKIVGGTTPLSTTDPWTWESWIWEKQHHTLHVDSEHIEPSGKPYPSLTRYQCLADAIESSKDHSAVISRQLLQVGGETQLEFQWLPWDGSVTALLWLWSESLGQKQCVEYHGSGRGILYVQENSMDLTYPLSQKGYVNLTCPTVTESCSVRTDSLWLHGLYSPRNSPGQNTGVGSFSLLQGIFPTQGSNSGLSHCRRILYQLSHKGSQLDLPH